MDLISASLVLFLGLAVGSFIGALTYRIPRGISIATGRSFCPHCKHQIAWYDNIPLLSYFLLKGCCRYCKKKISIRYPLIEGLTALAFLLVAFLPCSPAVNEVYCNFRLSLSIFYLPAFFAIASGLIAIIVVDLENQIIPDSLVFFLLLLSTIIRMAPPGQGPYSALAAGFSAALFLVFLYFITKQKGMGLGDVKYALFAGTFLGWPHSLIWLFSSFVSGAIVGVILIILGKASFGKHIAFGPFMVISLFATLFFGSRFLMWLGF